MNDTMRWCLINSTLNGESSKLRSLLSKRPPIDAFQACQLFHLSAGCGSTEILKLLLNFIPSLNVNCRDEIGCTALHKAATMGHREAIHFLIFRGAQVDVQDYLHGNSPLHEAASKGFSRSVEALCLSRCNLNLRNRSESTALHGAAQAGHKQTTRILISSGADVDAVNKFGDTTLHTAIRYSRGSIVRILLSGQASTLIANGNLDTPFHVAAALKRPKILRFLLDVEKKRKPVGREIISPLLIRNSQGERPIDIARRRGNADVVATLLTAHEWVDVGGAQLAMSTSMVISGTGDYGIQVNPGVPSDLFYTTSKQKGGAKLSIMSRNRLRKSQTALLHPPGNYTNLGNHIVTQNLDAAPCIPIKSRDDSFIQDVALPLQQHMIWKQVTEKRTPINYGNAEAVYTDNRDDMDPQFIISSKEPEARNNTIFINQWAPHANRGVHVAADIQKQSKNRQFLKGIFKRSKKKMHKITPQDTIETENQEEPITNNFLYSPICNSQSSLKPTPPISDALNSYSSQEQTLDDTLRSSLFDQSFQLLPFPSNSDLPSILRENGDLQTMHHFASMRKPPPDVRPRQDEQTTSQTRQNSAPRRVGVRFDLQQEKKADGQNNNQSRNRAQQPLVQLYRDLAGNVKKGPMSSPLDCNCIQRQAEFLAGNATSFTPCQDHVYLDCHVGFSNTQTFPPPHQATTRVCLDQTNRLQMRRRVRLIGRSRSDESLTVLMKAEEPMRLLTAPPNPQQKPFVRHEQTPRGIKSKQRVTQYLNQANCRSVKEKAVVHLPDVCIGNGQTNCDRPVSPNPQSVPEVLEVNPPIKEIKFAKNKLATSKVLPEMAKLAVNSPPNTTSSQRLLKSRSFCGQMTLMDDAVDLSDSNSVAADFVSRASSSNQVTKNHLYLSCRNIGGKLGVFLPVNLPVSTSVGQMGK